MTTVADYIKIVEWSEEDLAFVGSCPGVIGPCCHGADEADVYRQLCVIVGEWLEIKRQDGAPSPPATAGRGGDFERLLAGTGGAVPAAG